MQGGGSSGTYECGVFKTLAKRHIKFDIVTGTSIGTINAGIVAGSKSGHPEKSLEAFWLDVAETLLTVMLTQYFPSMSQESTHMSVAREADW